MVGNTFSEWDVWLANLWFAADALHLSNMEYAEVFLCRIANFVNERKNYGVIY